MMWMFLAILVTFLITRMVTRLIRSGSGGGAGLGNVSVGGNHVHHQVFGILIIIGTGIILVSQTPSGTALDAAAVVFGIGVGLTVDEFALWLHLKDVYWARQGRQSVDAIFCVLVITGALIGGTSFVTGGLRLRGLGVCGGGGGRGGGGAWVWGGGGGGSGGWGWGLYLCPPPLPPARAVRDLPA